MQQFIIVDYNVSEKFIIPKGINLRDKEQVRGYWVKYNYLHIELVSGEIIKVDGEGWIQSYDYKHPDTDIDEREIEEEDCTEDDEIQSHCCICFNMNMELNVTCFNCNKIYCKSHMHHCSK